MRESFEKPKMLMLSFDAEDIITTSCALDCDPVCENHCKSGICTGNCYSDTRAANIM